MRKSVLFLFILVVLLSCQVDRDASYSVFVQNGQADMSMLSPDEKYTLDGEWRFSTDKGEETIGVPSIWKGGIQSGIYRLDILLPPGVRNYSLYIHDCYTIYKLVVNGKILHNGTAPSIKPRIFTFSSNDRLSIEIHVTDRDTTYGGIKSSLFFGSPEKVQRLFNSRILFDMLLIGALIFAGIFYFSIWIVDKQGSDSVYIYLFSASLIMAVRLMTTYNRILLLFIDSFYIIEKISTITTPLMCLFYSLYFLKIYRYPVYRKIIKGFIGISALYSFFILLAPVLSIYRISPVFVVFMLIAVYSTIHVSILHMKTAELRRNIILWIVVMLILAFMMIRAFFIWEGIIHSQVHQVYGLLMLLQGLQNAIRYGETYKRNRRLIRQKDDLFMRVSHSLKTPLYGLKGSMDLIKNSENKCREFDHKYPVLESNLTDLTIQINDLLNQTEFEFSHQMVQTRIPVPALKQTILILDDQKMVLNILGDQLETVISNARIIKAESGERALFLLKTNNIHFIFCDLMMPEMDGLEFIAECRRLGYLVPIFLFSAGSNNNNKKDALDAGANGYLEKPITIDQLRNVTSLYLLQKESNQKS